MKILKIIVVVALICCGQSAFTMEKSQVHFKPTKEIFVRENKWIIPGRNATTQQEHNLAHYEAEQENVNYHARGNPNESYNRARDLAQEEENLYVTPEIRQQREQQLRQYYIQQREQEIMKSEQDLN